MKQAPVTLQVGGEWVHEHTAFEITSVKDQVPNGGVSLEWQMMLRVGERPDWAVADAPVVLHAAGGERWTGVLEDPEWDTGSFSAVGWWKQAEAPALTSGGVATNDPAAAITAARARGAIDFDLAPGVTIPALPGTATEINTIMALLDQSGLENDFRWTIGPDRLLRRVVEPTEPSLWLLPTEMDLPVTMASAVDCVVAEYDLGAGKTGRVTATTGTRRRERLIDLREAGIMTAARAQSIVDAILKRAGQGKALFVTGFEVAPGQVVDDHGAELDLSTPMHGQMIRVHGTEDPRDGTPWLDLVIGETDWQPGREPRVQVNPLDLSDGDDDFGELVESYGGQVVL